MSELPPLFMRLTSHRTESRAINSRSRAPWRALAVLVPLLVQSCASVKSEKTTDKLNAGIPYSLPQGVINVQVSGQVPDDGGDAAFVVNAKSDLAPDKNRTFVLNAGNGVLSTDDLELTLTEGMLSTVNSANIGQADVALSNITQTILNIQKLNVSAALVTPPGNKYGTASAKPKPKEGLDEPDATADLESLLTFKPELAKRLKAAANDNELSDLKKDFNSLKIEQVWLVSENVDVSKTEKDELIQFLAKKPQQVSVLASNSNAQSTTIQDQRFAEYSIALGWTPPAHAVPDDKTVPGVYVDTVSPQVVTISVKADANQILTKRAFRSIEDLKANRSQIKDVEAEIQLHNRALSVLQSSQIITIDQLKAELAKDSSGKALLGNTDALIKWQKLFEVAAANQETITQKKQAAEEELADLNEARAEVMADVLGNLAALYPYTFPTLLKDRKLPEILTAFETQTSLNLPDGRKVYIPMKDALIGKTEHKLSLNRGVLVSYSLKRPSSIVEFTKIPMDILGKLLAQASELLQLKINLTNQKKELTDAEKSLLASQKTVRDDLEAIKDEVKSNQIKDIELSYSQLKAYIDVQKDAEAKVGELKDEVTRLEALAKAPTNTEATNLKLKNDIRRLQQQIEMHENLLRVLSTRMNRLLYQS